MVGLEASSSGAIAGAIGGRRRLAFAWLLALDGPQLASAFVYVALFARGLLHFTDPDYWWHLATGRLIVESGSIPSADPFSFTAAGEPWVAHEWLADIVIYGVQSLTGYAGNALLFVVAGLASIALAHRTALMLGVSRWLAAGLAGWAGLLSFPYWTVRPAAFTWLLFALFIYVIVAFLQGRNRLWLLPPLMVLWANLHGGFVIGLVLVGLLFVSLAAQRLLFRERVDLRTPALVLAACFLATALNPHTVELWLYPLTYVQPGNASAALINEWQSPDFRSPIHLALAPAIVLLIAVGAQRTRVGLFLPAVALLLTLMALQSVRHQPLFAVAFLVAGAEFMRGRYGWARLENEPPSSLARFGRLNLALVGGLALALALVLPQQAAFQLRAEANQAEYPRAGAAFIRQNHADARIFNHYAWGGYLINELYPQRVFIDGRADMYGDELVKRFDGAMKLDLGWQTLLDDYDVDLAIVEKDSPLAGQLPLLDGWQLVFEGDVEAVFLQNGD